MIWKKTLVPVHGGEILARQTAVMEAIETAFCLMTIDKDSVWNFTRVSARSISSIHKI